MKFIATTISVLICFVMTLYAGEQFNPRLPIDHKKYIDEALSHLLRERPDIEAANLQLVSLNYSFQPMEGTTAECGPNGCIIKPAAPFSENLYVSFQIMDSKRSVVKDGQNYAEYDGITVQFPTPRRNHWFIGKSKITSYESDK